MNTPKQFFILFLLISLLPSCSNTKCVDSENSVLFLEHAEKTFESIFEKYGTENEYLLREVYPFSSDYKATYLNSEEQLPNQFSYLWPYSGVLSAASILYRVTEDNKYLEMIDNKILPGLEEYYDTERHPFGYSSYINRAPLSDRFYDDNVWIGIDFTDLFLATNKVEYLKKAKNVWDFVYSGFDDKLGGGIYWVEQSKGGKHTCSNAPGAVFALKMHSATNDSLFLEKGKFLYSWTKEMLQDKNDHLYNDNIRLDGKVEKTKYSYNSGQMLQAAVLLYNKTKEDHYLKDAQILAESCHQYFFHNYNDNNTSLRVLNNGDIWFSAVMFRGFAELYKVDKNPIYIKSFKNSLKHAWTSMRDEQGLFGTNWTGDDEKEEKWLLTQAAMVEMYTRYSCVNVE